jgi:hypothetical protein
VLYFFCAMATMLTMTATVKAMDSQRWVCRTTKRRKLRFDSGHRRQEQADASKKLTDPDEDERVLRHTGKGTAWSAWFHRAGL